MIDPWLLRPMVAFRVENVLHVTHFGHKYIEKLLFALETDQTFSHAMYKRTAAKIKAEWQPIIVPNPNGGEFCLTLKGPFVPPAPVTFVSLEKRSLSLCALALYSAICSEESVDEPPTEDGMKESTSP